MPWVHSVCPNGGTPSLGTPFGLSSNIRVTEYTQINNNIADTVTLFQVTKFNAIDSRFMDTKFIQPIMNLPSLLGSILKPNLLPSALHSDLCHSIP